MKAGELENMLANENEKKTKGRKSIGNGRWNIISFTLCGCLTIPRWGLSICRSDDYALT